jgi:hypothetical protein
VAIATPKFAESVDGVTAAFLVMRFKERRKDLQMLLLFLAITLTEAQQAKHDATEWMMYQQIQSDKETIADIWRPNPKLLSDYRRLQRCYMQFHLYRAMDCNNELTEIDLDLGKSEVARTKDRQNLR